MCALWSIQNETQMKWMNLIPLENWIQNINGNYTEYCMKTNHNRHEIKRKQMHWKYKRKNEYENVCAFAKKNGALTYKCFEWKTKQHKNKNCEWKKTISIYLIKYLFCFSICIIIRE